MALCRVPVEAPPWPGLGMGLEEPGGDHTGRSSSQKKDRIGEILTTLLYTITGVMVGHSVYCDIL